MKTDELREKYLAFFESKGHTRCPSDVLVPTWDPSVLFTPAGMNQFKDHFLGKVKLEFTRATTCQKCLRTGDIDNVGRTAYHHTFFEMLGNFSFGDYFKRDAINWAWEFLTDKKWLGIAPDRLTVTVYKDDDEAADIWAKDIGLTTDRIQRMDEDENFWPASAPSEGPDGVCGPCSEIYYHPESGKEVEIWNLVFTQFNRVGDPPDNLKPLPSKNIDTGMGLERTVATLQGVETNYHIDNLMPIVEAAAEVCGVKYAYDSDNGRRLRRITDHVRACTFAVHENVYPGANKEKYVVKRLLRRAVLDGHQMGLRDPFLHKLVPAVAEAMKVPYPDLAETEQRVSSVIEKEEANFFGTIDDGLARIERVFTEMQAQNRQRVEGGVAAELYQTYGVPPELFESLAADRQLTFDWEGYAQAMEQHGEVSGKVQHTVMGSKGPIDSLKEALHSTEFLGYESESAPAVIKGMVVGAAPQDRLADDVSAGEETVALVLDKTPFYGESGGQVGDSGTISTGTAEFTVHDTQKNGDLLIHIGTLSTGTLSVGDQVTAQVDSERRSGIRRAHSATHILHYALQKNLGSHAQQQGSKVDRDWLRFDFTNLSPVSAEQLALVEQDVHTRVVEKAPIQWQTLPLAEARAKGAMMLFGEKYPDPVRMVSMGEFSHELCGGTHLTSTEQVAAFEIIAEEGVSAGTRRITALTGERASTHRQQTIDAVNRAAEVLKVSPNQVVDRAHDLAARLRNLKKQLGGGASGENSDSPSDSAEPATELTYQQQRDILRDLGRQLNVAAFEVPARIEAMLNDCESLTAQLAERDQAGGCNVDELLAEAEDLAGTKVVVAELPMAGTNLMRQLIDQIRKKESSTAILFASREPNGKVLLIAGVSRDLVDKKVSAGNWVKEVAPVVGGGGGGKPDMAQAGGKDPTKTPEALAKARQWIKASLSA